MKMTIEALGKMSHFVGTLHPQAIKEVLAEMNLEILRGFDLDLPAILDLFPPEKIIETIDTSTLSEQERESFIEQLRQPEGDGN